MAKRIHTDGPCPVEEVLAMFGGKWMPAILHHIKDEPKRYNELLRLIPLISRRILTQQLRDLEASGLVQRTRFDSKIPRVEYFMTDLGRTLIPVFDAIEAWGRLHLPTVRGNQRLASATVNRVESTNAEEALI